MITYINHLLRVEILRPGGLEAAEYFKMRRRAPA